MVGFMQFLGILSILGGVLGIYQFTQININYAILQMFPYIVGAIAASSIIGFGVFWALAAIISNLEQINENLKEGS